MQTEKSYRAKATLSLKKDVAYPITLKYREHTLNAGISLSWSSNNSNKQIIPKANFFIDKEKTKHGLQGVYRSLKTYLCYTQNNNAVYAIALEWPGDEMILNIPHPGEGTKVTLLGLDKELEWYYKNDHMHINTSSISFNNMPSYEAWAFKINSSEQ